MKCIAEKQIPLQVFLRMLTNDLMMCYFVELLFRGYLKRVGKR